MAASTYFAQVQQLYIAYFGRPADTTGLNFWAGVIDAANGDIAAVQAGFSSSTESQTLFGNKSNIDKVTAIYLNTFGRQPEAAGLTFWVSQLETGKLTQAQAAWTIQQSAGSIDAAVVQAKLVAAQAFTAEIDTAAEIQGYQGVGAADAGRAFLATVVSTATGLTAVANAPAALASAVAGGSVGTTFTLTAGVDVLNGDGGNNVFTGDNTQTNGSVGAGDQLNGGAGTDTFNYFVATAAAAGAGAVAVAAIAVPQLNSVENVNLVGNTAGNFTADFSNAVGLQKVTLKDTTTAGNAITLGAGVAAGLDNAKIALNATFIGPATQTAATLNVVNGTNVTGTVDLQGAALTTLNVVSAAGAANTIGTLVSSNGTETTLNVSGAGDLTINAVGESLTTINASAATGKTSIDASLTTGNVAYTGGAADDTIKFGAQLTTGDVVNGGTGVNTLGVTTGASLVTGLQVTNVQTLDIGGGNVSGANSYNLSNLAGISTLKVGSAINAHADADDVTTINNLAKGAAVEINAALGSAVGDILAINVKDAGAGSPNDTLTVKLAAAANFTTGGELSIADIETVNLSSTTTGVNQTAHTLSVLNAAQATTVNVDASTNGLTIANLNALSLVRFDASASVKAVSVTTGADAFSATGGTAFILGQGNDTLNLTDATALGATGTAFVITGGKGGDAITLAAGTVDVLKYAAGDSFAGVVGAANKFDTVTNFTTTKDKIDISSFGFTGTVATIGTTAATIGAKGEIAAANTANFFGTGANQHGVVTATVGADTWVYVDANKDGSFQADTDLAIQLVGVAASVAADYVFA